MIQKGILSFALGMSAMMQVQNEEWKDRILKQWEESRNLPRKQKKAKRKDLNSQWSIACLDPFDVKPFYK